MILRCGYVTITELGWTDGYRWWPELDEIFPPSEGAVIEFTRPRLKTRPADESQLSPEELNDIGVSDGFTATAKMSEKEYYCPDCMMPDGAEPCKGYLQLQETAIQIAQEKHGLLSQVNELSYALDRLLRSHGYVSYCSEDERLSDTDVQSAISALANAGTLGLGITRPSHATSPD